MNGAGAMHIVHATLQAANVDPGPNIEPAEGSHSNHVPESSNSSNDSTSGGNDLRT